MSTTLPNTRAGQSATRIVALPAISERHPLRVVAVLCVLGALLSVVSLGHSSMFIDEVFSWRAAQGGMGDVAEAIRYAEVTPPLYYLLLHAWVGLTGAESEILLRLPSALAGAALVGVTWWLGFVIAGRRAAAIAGVLTALSPLVLDYAGQVRAYVFAMVAVTVAAAAVVEWSRAPERRLWPVVGAVAAAFAILLHYTAALVLVPIVVWALAQRQLPVRERLLYAAGCALPGLALVPLLLFQAGQDHQSGTAEYARITVANLFAVVGTPFDGRAEGGGLGRQLGAVAVVDALALLALGNRFRGVRARTLLLGACLVPLGAVLVASAFAQPAALTRYTAVAAPFIVVAIAVAVVTLPRVLGLMLAAVATLGCVVGLAVAMTTGGQHPDTRSAVAYAADHWERGDALFGLGYLGFDGALDYYADRDVPGRAGEIKGFPSLGAALNSPEARDRLADGKRLWFVSDPTLSQRDLRRLMAPVGYVPLEHREYPGNARVQVVLAGPRS